MSRNSIPRCSGVKTNGKPCTAFCKKGGVTCSNHSPFDTTQECPICYDAISRESSQMLKCKHMFHTECIGRWTGEMNKNTCPTCRCVIRRRRRRAVTAPPVDQTTRTATGQFVFFSQTEEGTLWAWMDETGTMDDVILVT